MYLFTGIFGEIMKKNWLDGKMILLTGATSGIGKELTIKLIKKHDCHVIGIGRNEEGMKKLKSELGEKSKNFEYKLFDVSIEENWHKCAQEIKNVDVLINNAGILPKFKKFDSFKVEDAKKVVEINFMASVYSINAFLPILRKSKTPAIINVSSSAALCPLIGTSLYTASKSALKSFTECLMEDFRKEIYVAYVCPGFTKTNIFRNQQVEIEKIVQNFCSSCEKNTKRILKRIEKKKKRIVVGKDAIIMKIGYRLFPRTFPYVCAKVLKKSKIKLFQDVFS